MTAAVPQCSAPTAPAALRPAGALLHDPPPAPLSAVLPAMAAAPFESWMLAWAAARSGFHCSLALGNQPPAIAFPSAGPAQYAVHLARAVPIATLIKSLADLRRNQAVLLVAPEESHHGYREHLRLDDARQVVSIHRTFKKQGAAANHPGLLGIAWKISGPLKTFNRPVAGPCWRTARAVIRRAGKSVSRQMFTRPAGIDDPRGDLIAQLTPTSLLALAKDLGFQKIGDFCFAAPQARVSEQAFLRGPLFIAGDAAITADHVHVGPGWVDAATPAVTLPNRPELMDVDTGDHASENPGHLRTPYFVGPNTRPRPRYELFKRLLDIPFACAALLATLPICLVAAVIIKLYDRGPVFFVHRRESVHGRPFGCLKFRTMVRDAEARKSKLRAINEVDGPQFKMSYDPRITPIGHFLRKTNIDELPQFINVLLGHMSVVGPRPSPFEENQLCPAWREARLSVKPGITGLWQVSRSRDRGAADFQEWIFYDTQYVERRGFFLDIKIILLTIKELFGKGQ